jgi:hypothetical protein
LTEKKKPDVFGGGFYSRVTKDGPLVPAPPTTPDLWICRRVVDFPDQLPPFGSAITACARCHVRIAYNPKRHPSVPVTVPKVCMQCARIEPLPIT